MILDDVDARSGSATSLLRTIVGVGLRRLGGWISVAELIRLMNAVGVSAPHTRTAISRVKAKGLLLPETRQAAAGYALNPEAVPMLESGDRRIFTFRQMADGDQWCLLSFSIPETQRGVRHLLRQRLGWIGCGTVSTGLWICPAFLTDEVEQIVTELHLGEQVTIFLTDTPRTAHSLAEAARRWWDLERLAGLHRNFLESQRGIPTGGVDPHDTDRHGTDPHDTEPHGTDLQDAGGSFRRFIRALDQWRILPYLDPGLPPAALPDNWPGFDSLALFEQITVQHRAAAHEFFHAGPAVG
ncbi:MAG: PaaX family transcriptional regulator C-terminal domain-containing protein [Terrimesophilobacter sp.]